MENLEPIELPEVLRKDEVRLKPSEVTNTNSILQKPSAATAKMNAYKVRLAAIKAQKNKSDVSS